MPRNRLPASVNPPDESQSEEDGDEVGQADGGAGNRHEDKSYEEAESEGDSSSVKTMSQNLRPEMKKRPPPDSDLKEVNKKKMSKKNNGFGVGAEDDDKGKKSEKSGGGLRLWSPEDELMILTGMLDYKENTGVDPNSNLLAFYNYIKGSLNASVDQSQLKNKIRKLKDKYRANAHKEATGQTPVFVRSHEAEAYEHSRKLWGDQTMSRGPQLTKSKPKRENEFGIVQNELESVLALPVTQPEVDTKIVKGCSDKLVGRAGKHVPKMMHLDETDLKTKYATISMPSMIDNFMVKKGLELIEKSKLDDLNEKWNKYQIDAAELYVKRLELEQEHIKLIGEALKGDS
uniref:Glabrous enhancer-binding protein-like DBD domain-containing protein n=1 Tax=Kalanchoe fedtschenkoi TaxID=63787 RepID=A0A7N1A4X9_KALFE